MGESIVAASNDEDKMGKPTASNPTLEVSVSFGRFENDSSLSWEKWSSFLPNKYLEEVEKCATPGSVASKKAYFEAHYKKIAARKAEIQDQARKMENDSLGSDEQSGADLMGKNSGTDTKLDVPISQTSAKVVSEGTVVENELIDGSVNENKDDAATNIEGQDSPTREVKVEPDSTVLCKEETATSVKEETASTRSQDTEELPRDLEEEIKPQESASVVKVAAPFSGHQYSTELPKNLERKVESTPILKKEIVKSDDPKGSKKISPMSKVREVATSKKKSASPAKAPQVSTPKVSMSVATSAALTASRSSTKKITGTSLPRNKTPAAGDSKRVAAKSLHVSLSVDTPSSDSSPPLTTARKSLIMERMKDKDIVQRAFKTFQNNFNHLNSPNGERALSVKQMPARVTEVKVSTSMAPWKETGGSRTVGGMDKKTAKAAPSSFSAESDERPHRRESLGTPKKPGEKSIVNKAESTHPQAKSKVRQEAEIKKLGQSHNFKATPLPGFYRVHKVAKSPLDKVGAKTFGM